MQKKFIVIPHTADIQIRVFGATLQELFEHALFGMFQTIEPRSDACTVAEGLLICANLDRQHTANIQASDKESLLVDFLSHALFLSDVHNEAYFTVQFHTFFDTALQATIRGVSISGFNVEIKAVTYHGMKLEHVGGLWQTDIVFDI
ncbi:MAG: archease [Candidatus Babeliales bacterium]